MGAIQPEAPGGKRKRGRKGPGRRALEGLLLGLACAVVFAALGDWGALDSIENRLWDLRARAFAKPSGRTDQIRLILLDQGSLDWAEKEAGIQWPWPREYYGVILSFLSRTETRAAAFDVLYTEASFWGVEDDQVFAEAVRVNGRFVGAIQLSLKDGEFGFWPVGAAEPVRMPQVPEMFGAPFPYAVFPIPELIATASTFGNVLSQTDPDGINRRMSPVSSFDGRPIPTLALAAFLRGEDIRELDFKDGELLVGGKRIPLDEKGRVVLRFRGPSQTHIAVNAGSVLRSETGPAGGGEAGNRSRFLPREIRAVRIQLPRPQRPAPDPGGRRVSGRRDPRDPAGQHSGGRFHT